VTETEQGIIPMTDFPFEQYSVERHLRIGTGGGWVKPSTGYSFKNSEKNARRIVHNLKTGKRVDEGLISRKFRWYDAIFLDVLHRHNAKGPELFYTMYRKNPIQRIFAFLDDESTLTEDLQIINGFPKAPFVRSFFRKNLGL
ncbi:MAG: hypothetical protein JNN28_21135, partial [Saprospiraceae bacterium]|nr:hypothetical protein [Saprospiraceae bacterium]